MFVFPLVVFTNDQIAAIYTKRARVGSRDSRSLCCSILVPIFLILGGLCVVKYSQDDSDDPSKLLSISSIEASMKIPFYASDSVDLTQATNFANMMGLLSTSPYYGADPEEGPSPSPTPDGDHFDFL